MPLYKVKNTKAPMGGLNTQNVTVRQLVSQLVSQFYTKAGSVLHKPFLEFIQVVPKNFSFHISQYLSCSIPGSFPDVCYKSHLLQIKPFTFTAGFSLFSHSSFPQVETGPTSLFSLNYNFFSLSCRSDQSYFLSSFPCSLNGSFLAQSTAPISVQSILTEALSVSSASSRKPA